MTDEYIKLDLKSFQDMARTIEEQKEKIEFLQTENTRLLREHRDLYDENSFLKRQVSGMKFRNGDLRRELARVTSMGMFEFADEFCNDDQMEDAGRAFARSLGVGK